jgi:hypothetical protein
MDFFIIFNSGEMEEKSRHLREHWKSASGDGTKVWID